MGNKGRFTWTPGGRCSVFSWSLDQIEHLQWENAGFIGARGLSAKVLFKFHSKTWCSDADENIKCRAKRVLDGVSKRYPQLLRESQFTESSIRKIMNTTDNNTPKNDRLSNFISVDVVILSLKHDKDVLVVTARGGFVRDVEVVIRYFKYSKSLKTKLNGMMRSETRCTVTNLCLNNTIEPAKHTVSVQFSIKQKIRELKWKTIKVTRNRNHSRNGSND